MAAGFSLLSDAWIPVLRADGSRGTICPAAITSYFANNPVVAPAWGRADFDAATREFLIGLLTVACGAQADDEEDAWESWFRAPPPPEELDAAFAPFATAFVLDGDGPRFEQDLEDFAGDDVPVSQLLIDAPGANTLKRNLDHFIRRGRVETLSRAGAAIALFTLQTYAPTGGAGHRVSVRGGGPLTTLLIPGPLQDARDGEVPAPVPLWRTLWLAVPRRDEPVVPARVFPWLVPTRVSDKGRLTTPADVDPLQAFWGMPRRIRLVFDANTDRRRCDLTGQVDEVVVRVYRTRPSGTSYGGFVHPLSPHYRAKETEPFLPVHGQPGGIGYRHWVGLVVDEGAGEGQKDMRRAAQAVRIARNRLADLEPAVGRGTRLLAAGYDMDNMKARAFIESEMPLHVHAARFAAYDRIVRMLIDGARETEGILRLFVRQALFVKRTQADGGFTKAPREGGVLDLARAHFWERTEAAFGGALASLAEALSGEDVEVEAVTQQATRGWLNVLRDVATAIFDDCVPFDDLDSLDAKSERARIEARHDLHGTLAGFGGLATKLYAGLGLATPEQREEEGSAMSEISEDLVGGGAAGPRETARRWWTALQPMRDGQPNWNADRGALARLRRASSPLARSNRRGIETPCASSSLRSSPRTSARPPSRSRRRSPRARPST